MALVRRLCHQPCKHDTGDADGLCERNVMQQVNALVANPLVQAAWAKFLPLTLRRWVCGMGDGLLRSVCPSVRSVADQQRAALLLK